MGTGPASPTPPSSATARNASLFRVVREKQQAGIRRGEKKTGDGQHQKELLCLHVTERCRPRTSWVANFSLESEMRNMSQVGVREESPAHPLASVYMSGLLFWPKTRLRRSGKAVGTANRMAESRDPPALLGNTTVCSPLKAKAWATGPVQPCSPTSPQPTV